MDGECAWLARCRNLIISGMHAVRVGISGQDRIGDLVTGSATDPLPGMGVYQGLLCPIKAILKPYSRLMRVGSGHGAVAGKAFVFNKTGQMREGFRLMHHVGPEIRVSERIGHDAAFPVCKRADIHATR